MTAGPVQCSEPSDSTATATGIGPAGRRCGRSNSSPRTPCTAPVSGASSKACVVTASSSSARVSASSSTDASRKSGISSSPGRGHAAVQCAPIPPTFVDVAASGIAAAPTSAVPGRAGIPPGGGSAPLASSPSAASRTAGSGDVLDVPAGRLAEYRAGLEHDHPQRLVEIGELPCDAVPTGPDPTTMTSYSMLPGDHQTVAGASSSSRLSMSCCARTWSKALYRSL